MNRVYGTLEIRAVDEEQRIVEGIANTASVDSYGTVIEPAGAVFNLPIPFSMHHRAGEPVGKEPVGNVIRSWIVDGKRWAAVHIPVVQDDGTDGGREVKRRVDKAWAELKNGLVRGFSIEFDPIEPRSHKATRWTKWRWLGLAGVSIPSNMDATIVAVRSAFESPGLSGTPSPGVSGTTETNRRHKMTIQDQIAQHEGSRAAKVAQREAIFAKCGEEGRTPEADEKETLETLAREVESHDEYLGELYVQKRANESAARPVVGTSSAAGTQSRESGATQAVPVNGNGTQTRSGVPVVRVRANTGPGIGMARCAMVLLRNGGNLTEAIEDARRTYPDQAAEMEAVLRAPVLPATTTSGTWAGPLVQPTTLASEFLDYLRPKTLLGRIPGFTQVDFNARVLSQTGTGTYNWVGEGKPKPLSALAFAAVLLAHNKVAGIIVLTEETVRFSTPRAEERTRDDMTKGIAGFMDNQLLDPTVTAIAGVRPAAITEGVAGTIASGTTAAAARADLVALLNGFGDLDLSEVVILMKPGFGFALGSSLNALGQPAFPGLGINGGNVLGVPVLTANITALASQIVAVHAPSILIADDGAVTIDMSREATLEMESTPADPVIATTVMQSLWQNNLVGLRAERFATWLRARAGSVRRIHTAAYIGG